MNAEILFDQLGDEIQEFYRDNEEITFNAVKAFAQIIHNEIDFEKMFVACIHESEGITISQLSFGHNQNVWEESEWSSQYNEFMKDCRFKDSVEHEEFRNELATMFEPIMYNSYGLDWIIMIEHLGDDAFKINLCQIENDKNLL